MNPVDHSTTNRPGASIVHSSDPDGAVRSDIGGEHRAGTARGKPGGGMATMRARLAAVGRLRSRPMRRVLFAILAVVVLAAAAWCGLWVYVARDIEPRLAAWAQAQRAQGLTAEYASVTVSGFPLAWHTR